MARQSYPNIDTLDNVRGKIYINRFDGGLNNVDSNEVLADNEAIIRQNWISEGRGAITKVNGFTKLNATTLGAKPIRGLFRVYQSSGTKKLLAICNGALKFSDDDGANFSTATNGTGLTETEYNTGVNYNDLFFFINQTDNLKLYTPGTDTMSTPTDVPTDPCRVLLKRADRRMIALNNLVNGSTLYFSKINPTGAAADDWSATSDAGSIAVDGASSEPLVGGHTLGSMDIIFKHYAAFQVWGYPNPQAVRMPGSPGCPAPFSCAQGDGLAFHLAWDGVYVWDGNKFINLTETIDLNINSSYIQNSFGVYRNGYYWLFYTESGQTTNKKCIIYDVFNSNPYMGKNIWFEREGLSMNCPLLLNGVGDANKLFAGASASTGFVYQLDYSSTGADDEANIEAIYQTKYFNGGLPNLVKGYRKIRVRYFNSKGSVLVYYYTNRGVTSGSFSMPVTQTGVLLGSFTLGTDTLSEDVERLHTERLPVSAIGNDISLKIYHDNIGTPPIIRDCEIDYECLYEN